MTAAEKNPFLATTALEDFWDTTRPIVFLGQWCCRFSREKTWRQLDGTIMEDPWQPRGRLVGTYTYIKKLYERLLSELVQDLNALHGTTHGLRYWRIVAGPWLQSWLLITYERYGCLRSALGRFPDLATIVLSPECYVTPTDTLDFMFLVYEDPFNLQLYSQVLRTLGKHFPEKKAQMTSFCGPHPTGAVLGRIMNLVKAIAAGVDAAGQNRFPVILKDSYFSRSLELQLFWRTGGCVWRNSRSAVNCPRLAVDEQRRQRLLQGFTASDEFESCVKQLLPTHLPQVLMESFDYMGREVTAHYPRKPRAILSANGWYYNEGFKRWAAAAAEDGAVLLGAQHGGNYGSIWPMQSEDHELAIVDRYYTWGWERADVENVIPLGSTKLAGIRQVGASRRKRGLLFGAAPMPRYMVWFPFLPEDFASYLDGQLRFVEHLAPELRFELRIRLHYADFGWDIAARLQARFPRLVFEKWEVPFLRSMEDCRLYICDHLSTTFVEAFAANKPCILFWSPEANPVRPEAGPYYDELRTAGILHDTPEQAAQAVFDVYSNLESWWNSPERQQPLRNFRQRFARRPEDECRSWAAELKRVLNGTLSPQSLRTPAI